MAGERDDGNPDLRSDADYEVTEVTTVSTGPLPGEPVVAPPLAGAGEIIEVAPGLLPRRSEWRCCRTGLSNARSIASSSPPWRDGVPGPISAPRSSSSFSLPWVRSRLRGI